MRASWLTAFALLPACSFTPGTITSDAASIDTLDLQLDAPVAGSTCLGTGLLTVCYAPGELPSGTYNPTTGFSTDVTANCDRVLTPTGAPELCVKHAETITVAANVVFSGVRPLVLLATGSITIGDTGIVDVSRNATSSETGCMSATPGASDSASSINAGAAGGGGGGFGSTGGGGGDGQSTSGGGGTGGGMIALAVVRGGCPGAKGGDGSGGTGGTRGDAGGAVYLIAGSMITVNGQILANGGGGAGGPVKAGGGGGGSGGLIGLDAPMVKMGSNGTLVANGGGGGEGGSVTFGGHPGDNASAWDTKPSGGSGTTNGGNGGDGAYGTNAAGTGSNNDAGGGGGGGVGYIKIYSASKSLNGRISPPPT